MRQDDKDTSSLASDFATQAKDKRSKFLSEYWEYLRTNKKWYLLPIILILLGVGALIVIGSSPVAPLIYTLF